MDITEARPADELIQALKTLDVIAWPRPVLWQP
jgi:hypothetical protein